MSKFGWLLIVPLSVGSYAGGAVGVKRSSDLSGGEYVSGARFRRREFASDAYRGLGKSLVHHTGPASGVAP